MDINATLRRIRDLRAWWAGVQAGSPASAQTLREYADEVTELTEAVDEWLSRGGFLPDAWARKP